LVCALNSGQNISIHAPAWGATSRPFRRSRYESDFNPRPRVGGDRCGGAGHEWAYYFNPRPRVGGDY